MKDLGLFTEQDIANIREQKRKDLRDHFAGLAMQAAVNALAISGSERSDEEIAQAAYEMADAMLKARGE